MTPADATRFLERYSFKGLVLVKHEGNAYTYSFKDYDHNKIEKALGKPAVTANKKVAIFEIKAVAKIGVSPANRIVRLIDLADTEEIVNKSHLGINSLSKELEFEYKKAQATPRLRLKYVESLFVFFNETKFHNRLPKLPLLVSPKPPTKSSAKSPRGMYYIDSRSTHGNVWLADFLFNAPASFFYEVFLHELCHAAVYCIDHVVDPSEGGHGKNWQTWMKKVGLDPRRLDPTQDSVYQTKEETAIDQEAAAHYGKLASLAELKEVMLLPHPRGIGGMPIYCYYIYKGRILDGELIRRSFTWKYQGKPHTMTWKTLPSVTLFFEKPFVRHQ